MSLKENNIFEFEDFQINLAERTLWQNGELIPLAPKVIETLCLLVENHGRLMTKDELMQELWADTFVEERNLTQNIFTLRKVLGEKEIGKKFIETLPRRGYRFVAEVRPVEVQEVIQVSHNKQTRITAEGFVSTQELTEAVKEIAKSLVLEKEIEAVPPKQIKGAKPKSFYKSVSFPAILVLSFLTLGAAFWLWQNGELNSRKSFFTPDSERKLLNFERLTHSGKVYFPTVSPDKKFIAYVFVDQDKYSIHLQNPASGSVVIPVEGLDNEIGPPRFSADGNYLYYRHAPEIGKTGNIYQVPILGGTPRIIIVDSRSEVSVSPNGERLAFFRFNPEINGIQLITCRSDNGADEKIIAERTGNKHFLSWNRHPVWSPDGQSVLVGTMTEATEEEPEAKGFGLIAININDGSEKQIKIPPWNRITRQEWMPDGKSILFIAQEKPHEPFQIWQVDFPSGDARRISNDSNDYRFISIAPDGSFLLTTHEKTFFNLWLIPASNPAEIRKLTFSSEYKHGNRGLSWTADGKQIIYTLTENVVANNLWTIDVETLNQRQITFDENKLNVYPRAAPDGKSVIFASNRSGNWHIWQVDLDGSNLRQVSDGIGESFPSITSDGNWLIYASPGDAPKSLWKKSLAGDETLVKLLDCAAGSNSVSPDGKQIVVSYLVEEEDGKTAYKYGLMPLEPTEIPNDLGFNPFHGSIGWKPDGSGFYWVDDGMVLNNLWFYSVKDKTRQQITNFTDLRMIRVSVSPDGNTIATARGSTVSNIYKISGFD